MRTAVALGNRQLFERAYHVVREQWSESTSFGPTRKTLAHSTRSCGATSLWRYKPGAALNASGLKETGLLADALWEAHPGRHTSGGMIPSTARWLPKYRARISNTGTGKPAGDSSSRTTTTMRLGHYETRTLSEST
jgi:hypothetical protein